MERIIDDLQSACAGFAPQVFSMFRRLDGTPVERDKFNYRYSYEDFVLYMSPEYNGKYTSCQYSDRLHQWDSDKFNDLSQKHFGNTKQMDWDVRTTEDIERFLQDYLDKPNYKLLVIMEGCNQASGYPIWHFLGSY